jgi:very-short-patch-repair endonuclease
MTTDDVLDGAAELSRGLMAMDLRRVTHLLESPIEELFAAGLLCTNVVAPVGQSIKLVSRKATYGEIEDLVTDGILCWPQASVGSYRVDFLLCQHLKGETRWLVVECDGHAFHEVTKEQAIRDKKRDRFFTSIGLPVVHFTGSELNANAFLCAMEALNTLYPVREDG